MNKKEAKKFKKEVVAGIERSITRRYNAHIAKLDASIKEARGRRRDALIRHKESCERSVLRARHTAGRIYRRAMGRLPRQPKAKRAEKIQRLRTQRRDRVHAARARCEVLRDALDRDSKKAIADLEAERARERKDRRELKNAEKFGTARQRSRTKAAERLAESDEAVERELPENLIPLWRRVRSSIKGSNRASRVEMFLRYVDEHPDEVWSDLEQAVEKQLREEQAAMERELARMVKEADAPGPRAKARKKSSKAKATRPATSAPPPAASKATAKPAAKAPRRAKPKRATAVLEELENFFATAS